MLGKYELLERIASGGMGVLYAGRNPSLDQRVAIKVLRSDFAGPDAGERFIREARAVSQLKHPNIVRVFDFGEDQDQLYFVMEYVSGETLKAAIDRRAGLTLPQRVQIFGQICDAMAYAHRAGWIHRDLKPGNIMLDDDDGLVKVLDFGLARQVNVEASQMLTRVTGIMGTPNYMSPEQATGSSTIDHRTDIFAATVILYELLTYEPAFNARTEEEALRTVLHGDPIPPSRINPELPPEIDAVVARGLAKSVDARFQSIDALRAAVVSAFDSHGMLAVGAQTIPRSESRRLSDVRPISDSKRTGPPLHSDGPPSYSPTQLRPAERSSQYPPYDRPSTAMPAATVHDAPSIQQGPRQRPWGMIVISGVVALLSIVVGVLVFQLIDQPEPKTTTAQEPQPRPDPSAAPADPSLVETRPDTPATTTPQREDPFAKFRGDPKDTARRDNSGQTTTGPTGGQPQPQRSPAEDKAAVERALSQLAAAYNRLDPEAVASLMVDQSADDFRQAFARYAAFKTVIQPTDVTVEGDQARVVSRDQRTISALSGTESQSDETVVYQLQRVGNAWRVVSRRVQ
jgi:serine/threonine-protein kinase